MVAKNPGKSYLLHWWSMDETTGATRADSHGSNDLTDHNTVSQGTAIVKGYSADFEYDNNEHFSLTSAVEMADFAAWSFFGFFDIEVFDKIILGYSSGASSILIQGDTDVVVYNITSNPVNFGPEFPNGACSMGVVWEGDRTVSLYIDSVLIDTLDFGAVTSAFYFDEIGRSGGVKSWDGLMDEVSVWNKALSQDEIDWLHNNGSGREYSELGPSPSIVGLVGGIMVPTIGLYDTRFKLRASNRDTALTTRVRNE